MSVKRTDLDWDWEAEREVGAAVRFREEFGLVDWA